MPAKERIVVNGVTYVREEPPTGTGQYAVTVTRLDGRSAGQQYTTVTAGSWLAALKNAANTPNTFKYRRYDPSTQEQ